MQNNYLILLGATIATLPIAFVLLFGLPQMLSYVIITASCVCFMAIGTMLGITMITFIQSETPPHLIGKVMSYAIAIITCARPIGQMLYGFMFDVLNGQLYAVIFFAVAVSLTVSLASRKFFRKL